MKNIFKQLLDAVFGSDKDWWVEVKTEEPACTYYFGPFEIEEEAQLAQKGYVDDLQQEGAKLVSTTVENRTTPQQLTIYEEGMDGASPEPKPAFSGQS